MIKTDFAKDDLTRYPKVTFPHGHVIFNDNDVATAAYIVESGVVQISKVNAAGEGMVFALLKKGSMFGELALIAHRNRSATATAMTEVVCHVIKVEDFEVMVQGIDPFTQKIMQQLIRTLYRLTNLHVLS